MALGVFVKLNFWQTNIEITQETDFSKLLELEEQYVQKLCEEIIRAKPDIVFTEKGVSGDSSFPAFVTVYYSVFCAQLQKSNKAQLLGTSLS